MIRRELAHFIYPEGLDAIQNKSKTLALVRKSVASLNATVFELKQHATIADDIIAKYKEDLVFDLEQFKTNRTYKINGTRMKLSQWLSNPDERKITQDWVMNNLPDGTPHDVKAIRTAIYKHFKSKDNHVVEKTDLWLKPSELIANGFKGDCEDWATFLHYIYQALGFELYMVLTTVNNKEGFSIGNHATLLYEQDGKYYVVESAVKNGSDYINDSLRKFGRVDVTKNLRYNSRMIYMSNSKQDYYQVNL
jgi:hypothetical protein